MNLSPVALVALCSGALTIAGAIAALVYHVVQVRRDTRADRRAYGQYKADEAVERERLDFRVTSLEGWREQVDARDRANMEMHEKVLASIGDMRQDNSQQHADMREYVHSEVRRVEESMSNGRRDVHQKIDRLVERLALQEK